MKMEKESDRYLVTKNSLTSLMCILMWVHGVVVTLPYHLRQVNKYVQLVERNACCIFLSFLVGFQTQGMAYNADVLKDALKRNCFKY